MDTSTVLVVCSEALARKSLVTALQKLGHTVFEAATILNAVSVMNVEPVQAVLVHWTRTQSQIPDVCQALRELDGFSHLACVVVSEHRASEDVLTAVEAGADDFLAWPIELPVLGERVMAAATLTAQRAPGNASARIKHLYMNR